MMDFRNILIKRAVMALLIAQAATCAFLLTLNAFNAVSEAQFMLLLGVNLISLDIVIYVYLTVSLDGMVKLKWIGGGVLMILLFLGTAIFFL